MSLNFRVLPQVLFRPKEAFESIKEQTTLVDGVIMYIILALIGALIGVLPNLISSLLFSISLGMGAGLLVFLFIAWLSSKLAESIGKGTSDVGKTIGFLGYSQVVSLVMSVVTLLIRFLLSAVPYNPLSPSRMIGFGFTIVGIIVGFIWSLYVAGSGVAVANKVTRGTGILSYFLGVVITVLIVLGVLFLVGAFVYTAYMRGLFWV